MKRKSLITLKYSTAICAALVCGTVSASPHHLAVAKNDGVHAHHCTSADGFSAYMVGNVAACARPNEPVYTPEPTYDDGGAFTISGINGI